MKKILSLFVSLIATQIIFGQNVEKAEVNFNKPLVAELDSIYNDDQKYRLQISDIEKKFGLE